MAGPNVENHRDSVLATVDSANGFTLNRRRFKPRIWIETCEAELYDYIIISDKGRS